MGDSCGLIVSNNTCPEHTMLPFATQLNVLELTPTTAGLVPLRLDQVAITTRGIMSVNPVTRQSAIGELAQDVLAIQSSPGVLLRVPQYLFVCAPSQLLQKGLPLNVQGVVGFGHSTISLPNQLVSNFALQPIFAMCLTSSPSKNGIIFFGAGPYNLLPGRDFSRQLVYTPLIVSPAGEYYIQVSSIRINSYPVPINPSLLQINYRSGSGGTMISTTNPFTVLEHSIFVALSQSFAHELLKSG
ncbi:basic 7S globulin-like [Quillaja saponaria]|uniref:Basic 7S globulin-like n=1 Tax=Quillaja saponaria TaxID=32244 RepID=A0AAD7QAP1_QUISA|nr:basic 7S globulin-like [Quillaja saponaria]